MSKPINWEELKVDLPAGEHGIWKLDHFDVDAEGASRFNLMQVIQKLRMLTPIDQMEDRGIWPGRYTRLSLTEGKGKLFMTDTPAEIGDHLPFIVRAFGDVLITGLGLGVVVQACLRKDDVRTVTVIENSYDVIALVAPTYYERWGTDRLRVIEADAYTWEPDRKFTCAWHDIWPTIDEENLPLMDRLRFHYRKHVRVLQMFWSKPQAEWMLSHANNLEQIIRDRGDWNDYLQYREKEGFDNDNQ